MHKLIIFMKMILIIIFFLNRAALKGNIENIKLLVQKGANIDKVDDRGNSAILLAASQGLE